MAQADLTDTTAFYSCPQWLFYRKIDRPLQNPSLILKEYFSGLKLAGYISGALSIVSLVVKTLHVGLAPVISRMVGLYRDLFFPIFSFLEFCAAKIHIHVSQQYKDLYLLSLIFTATFLKTQMRGEKIRYVLKRRYLQGTVRVLVGTSLLAWPFACLIMASEALALTAYSVALGGLAIPIYFALKIPFKGLRKNELSIHLYDEAYYFVSLIVMLVIVIVVFAINSQLR